MFSISDLSSRKHSIIRFLPCYFPLSLFPSIRILDVYAMRIPAAVTALVFPNCFSAHYVCTLSFSPAVVINWVFSEGGGRLVAEEKKFSLSLQRRRSLKWKCLFLFPSDCFVALFSLSSHSLFLTTRTTLAYIMTSICCDNWSYAFLFLFIFFFVQRV